ncbi:MAG: hypothetical protein ACON4N_09295 [Myxococcota bacterium]
MGAVDVRPIDLRKDLVAFVKSWWPIYDGDPHWVPPLMFDRKNFLHPDKNAYFKHADIQAFMAFRDGQAVGTITAQIDHDYQKREDGKGIGFFGFFEFMDDVEVATALSEAAAAWLRERGMTEMHGPFNFTTNHEFGLLCDGFQDPPVLNPYNRPYYEQRYQDAGLSKVKDWFAYWIDRGPVPGRFQKMHDRIARRHPNISVRHANLKDKKGEISIAYDIYNDAWEENWGHSHISEPEFAAMAKDLLDFADPKLVLFAYVDDEPAAVAVTLPDFNQVVKKCNGSLFPFGWYHLLFGRSNIDRLRVFILGVKRKFQHLPMGIPLYVRTWEAALENPKITGADASLVVEDNYKMRGALEKLGAKVHMTYRIYGRKL